MRYLPEQGLGLPLAQTKDASRLDHELLEKASVQAGVPRGLVKGRRERNCALIHRSGFPAQDGIANR